MENKYMYSQDGLGIVGEWTFEYDSGLIIKKKNLILAGGLNYLAALFIGENTNTIPFYLAMGTGTTGVLSTDTKLQTESFRKIVSAKTRQGNMLRLRTYLLANEGNGNWNEYGIALAGTDQANSGTLFNRLVAPISKTSNTGLTIECRLTLSAG